MSAFVQSPRGPNDGEVAVNRVDGGFALHVTHSGYHQVLHCTEHNASRLFAALALMLGITLSKAVQKAIKL